MKISGGFGYLVGILVVVGEFLMECYFGFDGKYEIENCLINNIY